MTLKQTINNALRGFTDGADFTVAADALVRGLGYASEYGGTLHTAAEFLDEFDDNTKDAERRKKMQKRFKEKVASVYVVAQTLEGDLRRTLQEQADVLLESARHNLLPEDDRSFVFLAVETTTACKRADYAEITRLLNRYLPMPLMVVFRNKEKDNLTFAFAQRNPRKNDPDNIHKEVLSKVSLLCDIDCEKPHRGHLNILHDLSLEQITADIERSQDRTFEQIYSRWWKILNVEKLNNRFYDALCKWFIRATKAEAVLFPQKQHINENIIRLLSRILFIWFIKEKNLVDERLFEREDALSLLTSGAHKKGDSYYRVILQNLFFATLNTPIKERGFRPKDEKENIHSKKYGYEHTESHRIFKYLRYEDLMKDSAELQKRLDKSPFVNGGLFECLDPLEAGDNRVDCFSDNKKDRGKLSVPDSLFFEDTDDSKGLFNILENYKFTVEESTPIEQEVALDPELLGKVFERLLGYVNEGRKQTGSYYTPRVIVDYMVREALLAYYAKQMPKTSETTLRNLLTEEVDYEHTEEKLSRAEIRKFIDETDKLRLLDPAVGSGAFPMGVLAKLTMALRRIDPKNEILREHEEKVANLFDDPVQREDAHEQIAERFSEKNQYNNYARKLLLIQKSIFGVDLQITAVQICRLRFFISLVIEQDTNKNKTENYGITPLPNLETKIIAADTLIKVSPPSDLFRASVEEQENAIQRNRERFFATTERQKKNKIRKEDAKLRKKLEDFLMENDYPVDDAHKIAQWDFCDHDSSADWFHPQWMFGVDAFDVVIGNPPYVQLQKDGGRLADKYEDKGYRTFDRSGDIYCLFYESGLKLCRLNGHLCYITSNKWMRTGYGKATREFFAGRNPLSLIDLGPGIFDATVDTNILLTQNASNQNELLALKLQKKREYPTVTDITEQVRDGSVLLDIANLGGGASWFVGKPEEFSLINKVEKCGMPLRHWNVSINYGIKTGYNDAFIIDASKQQEILNNCVGKAEKNRTADIIKPVLRGRDIKRYHAKWANLYLICTFPALRLDIKDYPAIEKYLLTFGKDRLEQTGKKLPNGKKARKKSPNQWFETQDQIACYPEFEREKIVWPMVSNSEGMFTYVQAGLYLNNKCYLITGERIKLIHAILNSKLAWFVFSNQSANLGVASFEIRIDDVKNFTIPQITPKNSGLVKKIEGCVEKILAAKAKSATADTRALEREIDALVYRLYDLTPEEIAIIEGNSSKDK